MTADERNGVEKAYQIVRRRFDVVTDRAVYVELDAICSALDALRLGTPPPGSLRSHLEADHGGAHTGCTSCAEGVRAERKTGRFAAIAGDLWNEMENCRKFWSGTDREYWCELVIADYEAEAGIPSVAAPDKETPT